MAIQDSHPGAPYYYPQPASDSSAGGTVDAADVTSTPAGNIAASNVQDALNELDTEKFDLATNDADDVTETADRSFINPDQVGTSARRLLDPLGIEQTSLTNHRIARGWLHGTFYDSVGSTPFSTLVNMPSAPGTTGNQGSAANGTGRATDANGEERYFVEYRTTATINSRAGIQNNTTDKHNVIGWTRPYSRWHMKVIDITNVRIQFAHVDTMNNLNDAQGAGTEGAGFRFSTSAGDTNWIAQVWNGGTETNTDTGIAVTANTMYVLEIDWTVSGTIKFRINGVVVATVNSNIPSEDTSMTYYLNITTLAAAIKAMKIGSPIVTTLYDF